MAHSTHHRILPVSLLITTTLSAFWLLLSLQRNWHTTSLQNGFELILALLTFLITLYLLLNIQRQALAPLKRLQTLLDTAVDGIITIDQRGIIQSINPAACTLFGYDADELIGQNVNRLMPAPYAQAHNDYVTRYLTSTQPHIIGTGREAEGLRKDGSTFPIHLSVGESRLGKRRLFTGIIRDLTQSKRAEQELRESETRLQRSQQFANIGSWDWNIQTGELYWSERISPLFGGPEGRLNTSYDNFIQAIHPDDRQRVQDAVTACVEHGAEYNIEHRVVWPDGTQRWLLEKGDVIRDEQGTPLHMLGVVQDITTRKQIELALTESEQQLRQAQKLAHVGHWHANLLTGELRWSEEIFHIFGLDPATTQPSVQLFKQSVHPDDLDLVETSEANAQRTGRHDVIHRIIRPNGEVRHVHELAQARRNASGQLIELTGTVQDITEQKQTESTLTQHRQRRPQSPGSTGHPSWTPTAAPLSGYSPVPWQRTGWHDRRRQPQDTLYPRTGYTAAAFLCHLRHRHRKCARPPATPAHEPGSTAGQTVCRSRQPRQIRIPLQHEPRTAHPSQRHHRL